MLHLISKKKKTEKCNRHVPNFVLENRTAQKKRGKKTVHKMMIKREKTEKTAETKCKSGGRSYSAPKPV